MRSLTALTTVEILESGSVLILLVFKLRYKVLWGDVVSLGIQFEIKIETSGRWRLDLTLINLLVHGLTLLNLIYKALILCSDSTSHVTCTV